MKHAMGQEPLNATCKIDPETGHVITCELPRGATVWGIRHILDGWRIRYDAHYHPRHHHRIPHVVGDMVGAIAIISLILINAWVFGNPSARLGRSVDVMVRGADAYPLVYGQETDISIDIASRNTGSLSGSTLHLYVPPTLAVVGENGAETLGGFMYSLGTLDPLSTRSISVKLVRRGVDDTAAYVRGYVDFSNEKGVKGVQYLDFSVRFSNAHPVEIAFEPPQGGVFVGQNNSFTLTYRMPSRVRFQDVRADVALITDNGVVSATPIIPVLEGEGRVQVSFVPARVGDVRMQVRLFCVSIAGCNGGAVLSQTIVETYPVVALPLAVRVEPATPEPLYVGGVSSWNLVYTNTSAADMRQVEISIQPEAQGFVIDMLPEDGFVEGDRMIFRAPLVPTLESLSPGAEGKIVFRLRVKEGEQAGDKREAIRFRAGVRYRDTRDNLVEQAYELGEFVFTTQIRARTDIRYITPEGDQVGRGPNPPRMGQTTRYMAYISLASTLRSVADTVVVAYLAPGVEFTGVAPVGGFDMNYDDVQGKVTFTYGTLEPREGQGVVFEIAYTPSRDRERSTPLIREVRVEGKDIANAQRVQSITKNIRAQEGML